MRPSLGISLKLVNLLIFTAISICFGFIASGLEVVQSSFIISSFATLCFLPWILYTRGQHLRVNSWKKYILRAIFNTLGFFSWLYALRLLGANEATAISYMIPIFTCLLAIALCGEALNWMIASAIAVSFVGVYIILQPNLGNLWHSGAMVALLSSALWACHDITCKLQTVKENHIAQAFIILFLTAMLQMPFAISSWQMPGAHDWQVLAFVGVLAALNVIVLFLAYRFAPVTLLMPFSYLRIVFMSLATYVLYGEALKESSVYGVLLIVLASMVVYYQQRKVPVVAQQNP